MARPKKPPEERRSAKVVVNLTPGELELLDGLRAHQSRSGWFTDRLKANGALHPSTVDYLRETAGGRSLKGSGRRRWIEAGCPNLPEVE